MKYNDNIILTITDFIKYFDFVVFWKNRHAFVRDMNPEKIYYWDEAHEQAYKDICAWIVNETDPQSQNAGVKALSELVGKEISLSMIKSVHKLALEETITKIECGKKYELQELSSNRCEKKVFPLSLKKVEFYGESTSCAQITLSGMTTIFKPGDTAYVTVSGNNCIEILTTKDESAHYSLKIENHKGVFGSKLIAKHNDSDHVLPLYDDITSFAVFEQGFLYIQNGILCFEDIENDFYKEFLNAPQEPLYVKSIHGTGVLVLYKNGEVRWIDNHKVYKQSGYQGTFIDEMGHIIKL